MNKAIQVSRESQLLKSWIQNRLREFFLTQEIRYERSKGCAYDSLFNESIKSAKLIQVDSFDVSCHGLRILKLNVVSQENALDELDAFLDALLGINPKDRPPRSQYEPYRQAVANLQVTYQEEPNKPTKMLQLTVEVGQIDDISLIDETNPYVFTSEKRAIDVNTRVFPYLEDWSRSNNLYIKLPVPICFFGTYEDTKKVHQIDVIAEAENAIGTDDIMGKVAVAMELDKRPEIFESHRILLLENIKALGFEDKTAENSLFLPLLSVQAALQQMAIFHSLSWAFAEKTGKTLTGIWPFLKDPHYLPYLKTRATSGLPLLINLLQKYLTIGNVEDREVLSYLGTFSCQLSDNMDSIFILNSGPLTLIHQDLNSGTVLFRNTLAMAESVQGDEREESFQDKYSEIRVKKKSCKNCDPSTVASSVTHSTTTKLIKREVCFVEWENVSVGSPMIDVAFFLLTSLSPNIRKVATVDLLKMYWSEFREISSRFGLRFSWPQEDLYQEYIKGLLLGCILIAANVTPTAKPSSEVLEIIIEAVRDIIKDKR